MLVFLGEEYAKRNFVMQLHIGAERYTSSKLREKVGPAGGFAGIGNSVDVRSLTAFLDTVDRTDGGLPKTVLFTLNPADNALISVLSGSYAKDNAAGLITQGPAWWWCDHKQGIAEIPNIAGIKDAGGNMSKTMETFRLVREKCDVYSGEDALNLPILACGGAGVISVLSNIVPADVKKLCYENAKSAVGR